jgi:hypothetical protein
MTSLVRRALFVVVASMGALIGAQSAVAACEFETKCPVELGDHAVSVSIEGVGVPAVVGAQGPEVDNYAWRLFDRCVSAAETTGYCSPTDVRECPPAELGRVVGFFVVERRPVVRSDEMFANPNAPPEFLPAPDGFAPGDPVGDWRYFSEGCFDITPLNPPPSPGEVFSYFQRLPLPTLTTQHQPPGNGLSGLPVIFYTDSPTTQTFTVDIRGFSVVIEAKATQYTWHTGDPATPAVVSTDPGRPYPNETVEHDYRSGTYSAYLTVTWGATFTVNGSAPQNVPGSTTTDGPPVTFDVLQARPVLTNPYN